MKKALLLSFLTVLSLILHGQDFIQKKINFKVENVPIVEAIDLLAEKTGIDIAYSKNFFRQTLPVSLTFEDKSIADILQEILKGTVVQFKTLGENRVLLFKRKIEYETLSGYVENAETGERIVGARIFSDDFEAGAITNEYGFFSLQVPDKKLLIRIRSVGFKPYLNEITVGDKSDPLFFKMHQAEDLPKVIVDGREKMGGLAYSSISVDQDNISEVSQRLAQSIPTLNGQPDFVRVAQMLPGVQGQSDGFGGVSIRGGESGQNLMLMDGTPVYIPYHLMGLYSAYNPETVKTVKVLKGNFPARYGGAVSSVLDVHIREGDLYTWKGAADINLLNAGMSIEGPLKNGKGSLLAAGRISPRAYFFESVLKRLYFQGQADELNTSFYDLNLKANYKLSKKDRVYLSFFSGEDIIFQSALLQIDERRQTFSSFDLSWENTLGSLRWNHLFNKSLFLNTTLTYSKYGHRFSSQNEYQFVDETSATNDLFLIDNRSSNIDLGVKADFDYSMKKIQKLRFGVHYNYRNFSPSFYFVHLATFDIEDIPLEGEIQNFDAYYESREFPTYLIHETAAYIEDHIKLKRWYFNPGLRLSGFFHENSEYINLEPRILGRYTINEKMSVSLAANKRVQYLHLIANPFLQLPNDLWLPSGEKVAPQEMYEAEGGFKYQFSENLAFNIAAYYRYFNKIYSVPGNLGFLFATEDYSEYEYLVEGKANSKGVELLVDYGDNKRGLLLTYTLSETKRVFDSINLGLPYHSNLDSRHQINFAFHQDLSKSFKVGMNWVFRSPTPKINVLQFGVVSADSDFRIDEDPPGQKNQTRGRFYNRFDVNLQYRYNGKKADHRIKFGIYNFLNAANTVFYGVQYIDFNTGEVLSTPLKSLPILPSFSYRISF